jgi:uncharacterized protein YqgV (UPF0045/DUF77 family)
MQASIEISLYPFDKNYKKIIKEFILKINENKKVVIETNYMSTQIFGDYDEIILLLKNEMKELFEKHKAVFVVKIVGKNLKETE